MNLHHQRHQLSPQQFADPRIERYTDRLQHSLSPPDAARLAAVSKISSCLSSCTALKPKMSLNVHYVIRSFIAR